MNLPEKIQIIAGTVTMGTTSSSHFCFSKSCQGAVASEGVEIPSRSIIHLPYNHLYEQLLMHISAYVD